MRFDIRVLKLASGWWSGLLAGPSAFARVAIAFVAIVLVLGGLRLSGVVREFRAQAEEHLRWRAWFALHLLSFGATFALASYVASRQSEAIGAWVVSSHAGSLLAAAALAFWFASLVPPGYWFRRIIAERAVVLAGCVVAVATWYLGKRTQDAWGPLNDWTFRFVDQLLRLVYPEIITIPERRAIGPPQFIVQIGAECSGYEGIGLICVFLAVFFWVFRRRLRFPAAWLLWPLGILAIWICNSFRIAALVMVGTFYSEGVAVRGFHSQAGWLFFNLVALGLMAIALKLPFFVQPSVTATARPRTTPVAAFLLPLLVLIAMNMLIAAFSDGFDQLYPLKVILTAAVLFWFRCEYKVLDWSWSWGAALNGILVFVVWIILAGFGVQNESEIPLALEQLSSLGASLWLIFRVAGSVLTVPLAEELAFRGYLLRRFVSADFDEVAYDQAPLWAVFASSLLFGLMHGRWLAGTFAGLCYAFAARRRGQLCDAVVAHSITNALIAADVLLAGAWSLW